MIWNCFGSLDSDEWIFSIWQTNSKKSSNIWIGRAHYLQFSQAREQRWILANNEHQYLVGSPIFVPFFFLSCCCCFFCFFPIFFFLFFFSLSLCVKESFFEYLFCLPICIQRVPFFYFFLWPCGQKRLNYLTRMRRGSNNRETPKGVPSSKNNRQLVTCWPFRDSCMRTKPNSYRHGSYRLGRVYRQGSKTLFHAYGPWSVSVNRSHAQNVLQFVHTQYWTWSLSKWPHAGRSGGGNHSW